MPTELGGGGGTANNAHYLSSFSRNHLAAGGVTLWGERERGEAEALKQAIAAAGDELRVKHLQNAALAEQLSDLLRIERAEAGGEGRKGGGVHAIGGEGAAGARGMSEEEELRMMEMNPQTTDLYLLRKNHLKEMVSMRYELEILRQQVLNLLALLVQKYKY